MQGFSVSSLLNLHRLKITSECGFAYWFGVKPIDNEHPIIQAKKTPYVFTYGVFVIGAWQFPTFAQVICTIIGAKRFHFRGRDGIGWFPLALATRQTGWRTSYCS